MRLFLCDQFRGYRRIQMHLNPRSFYLRRHGKHGRLHFLFAGRFPCQQELSAKMIAAFINHRPGAAFLQYKRRLHPGNSAACDKHLLRLFTGNRRHLRFQSYRRISQAGDVGHIQIGKTVIAALITAYTGYDVLSSSCLCLVAEFRIRQLSPADNHHIHLVFFQNLLRQLRRIDSADANCQHAGFFPDICRIINIEAAGQIKGRHLIFQSRRYYISSGNIQDIHACFLCPFTELRHFFYCQPVFKVIIMRIYSHENRHVRRDRTADGTDGFQRETRPVFQGSAVFVRPMVDSARQEGMGQIVMRAVELHAVKARFCSPCRRFAKTVRYVMDLFHADTGQCKLRRHRHVRGHIHHCGRIKAYGNTSLPKLDPRLAPRFMDGIRQLLQPRNILILCNGKELLGGA